ncbi:hypothetical protein AGMMS50268_26530 [Spirochaetia bacterium]|nr:hypothetical protein AGMMS50268_26530 [Spirochaetia bacterium]
MKGCFIKRILLIIFLFFAANVLYADIDNVEKKYNYYHRNTDGTYILENINETGYIPFFSYVAVNKNLYTEKIIGYYYGTNIIKFIDEIDRGKIKRIEYHDKNTGEIIFSQINTYEKEKLNSVSIVDKKLEGRISYLKIFFRKDLNGENLLYSGFQVREVDVHSFFDLYDFKFITSEGIFNQDYLPIKKTSSVIRKEDENFRSYILDESYLYSEKKELVDYSLFLNDKMILTESIEKDENSTTVTRRYFNRINGNDYLAFKNIYQDDLKYEYVYEYGKLTKQNPSVSRFKFYKNDLFVQYNIDYSDINEYETGEFTLCGTDEFITFNSDNTIKFTELDFLYDVSSNNFYLSMRHDD